MKVLVADKVSEEGISLLEEEFTVDIKLGLCEEELISIIQDYDALLVRSETKVTEAVINAADSLKVIGRAGVGVDNIDVSAATKKGIIVLNAPAGNTIAATEHTMAMMLALARNIPQAYLSMRDEQWKRSKYVGVEVRGKTLGVIGLGRIGLGVAKRAQAMEMKIIAYDPFINPELAEELNIELAGLDELYARADFITLHLPLTKETKYMINKQAFAKMKHGIRIINCARGGVIEEKALAEAIELGIVAGAALDVFESEPVDQSNPLLTLENVITTPHLGASTKEAQIGVAVDVAAGVIAALKDEPIMSAVNMPTITGKYWHIIKPYMELAEKMGNLAVQLCEGHISRIEVIYNGEISQLDTKMLTLSAIRGVLNPVLQEPVNCVNAQQIAKTRGIRVSESKSNETEHFTNLLTIRVLTNKGEHRIAGTFLGGNEERIVLIDDYRVDVEPQGWLIIIPHKDHPGMVGRIGSLLGENSINITGMQVGRTRKQGQNIMVVSVQDEIPDSLLQSLRTLKDVQGAELINFKQNNASYSGDE